MLNFMKSGKICNIDINFIGRLKCEAAYNLLVFLDLVQTHFEGYGDFQ